ncbi:MDR family MFS transporter [Cohnella yongneupensis]|uniref:MDR family MFS transporter n=1 Tax=Cohnella yongneupensis TaxID=425006 RepID=A0ABW0R4A9_9BACL
MNRMRLLQAYHPIVLTLIVGHGLSRIASSMSLPFLALYLANTTDMSPMMIGVVAGAGPLAGTVGGFFGGALSDRFGRRTIMFTALVLWSFVFFGFSIANQPVLFLLLNLTNGLCRSWFEPVAQALMADLTEPEKRFRVFSMRYMAANIGVAVGPMLGAWLGVGNGSLPFLVTGSIYVLYGIILYSLFLSFGIRKIEGAKKASVTIASAWDVIRRDRVLRLFLLGAIVVGIAYCQMTVTLSQFVEGNFKQGVHLFAMLMSANALTVVTLQIPLSSWAEKYAPIKSIHVGNVLFAAGLIGFAISGSWVALVVSMIVFTMGEILNYPAGTLLMDKLAPEGLRGTYYGAQSLGNFGQFIGPMLGGFLLDAYGGTTLFLFMGCIVLSASYFYQAGQRRLETRPV